MADNVAHEALECPKAVEAADAAESAARAAEDAANAARKAIQDPAGPACKAMKAREARAEELEQLAEAADAKVRSLENQVSSEYRTALAEAADAHRRAELAKTAARNATSVQSTLVFSDLAERLCTDVEAGTYDELAAYALSVASTWAYARPELLLMAMENIGWKNAAIYGPSPASATVRNDPLLVETTATFLHSGKVLILCFRGTEPVNLLAWLSDATAHTTRFFTWGQVHTGFYNSIRPLWPFIENGFNAAMRGRRVPNLGSITFGQGGALGAEAPLLSERIGSWENDIEDLEAIYITGHSLGAALAVLAGAILYESPKYACIREKLRGIYCFGQPRVGDQEFGDECDKRFGDRLFRHVYEGDIVTRFPPRIAGAFSVFGQEYTSTSEGWTHQKFAVGQTLTFVTSSLLSIGAWVAEQIPFFRALQLPLIDLVLRPLGLPLLSLGDHSPYNYMNCSRQSLLSYK